MNYPTVKRCLDCRWATAGHNDWAQSCTHPLVNAADPYYLSYTATKIGTDCTREREKGNWRGKCGMRGKLFEPTSRRNER